MKLEIFSSQPFDYGVVYIPFPAFQVGFQFVLDHVDHDLIADETALIHSLFRITTKRRLLRNLRP